MTVTRFAPSPTGYLHPGHAYSALFAFRAASQGNFLLRIEDIDPIRCKPEFTDAIIEDLHWIGLRWQNPVRYQSQHLEDYKAALDVLRARKLIYPCFCTRREIEQEVGRVAQAPHSEDGSFIYPGTCRNLSTEERAEKVAKYGKPNWRLDCAAAQQQTGELFWHDRNKGKIKAIPEMFGDVVLARKDIDTSYHLSVAVDDYLQGITIVTRGEDLFTSTHIHRTLQALLGYETPDYHHHKLLYDCNGRRYAKRDKSVTLRALRMQGKSAESILELLEV